MAGSNLGLHVPVLSTAGPLHDLDGSAAVFDGYELHVAARAAASLLAATRALIAASVAYFTAQLAMPTLIPRLGPDGTGVAVWFAAAMAKRQPDASQCAF